MNISAQKGGIAVRIRVKSSHTIDFLFPMTLLLLFAVSAMIVLLLAANIYRSSVEDGAKSDTARTAAAYISEKIRQYDESGAVSLTEFDGCEALQLVRQVGERRYCTYIYAYDGALRELLVTEGYEASASDGAEILDVASVSMDEPAPGLFRFTIVDADGRETTECAAVHSSAEVIS